MRISGQWQNIKHVLWLIWGCIWLDIRFILSVYLINVLVFLLFQSIFTPVTNRTKRQSYIRIKSNDITFPKSCDGDLYIIHTYFTLFASYLPVSKIFFCFGTVLWIWIDMFVFDHTFFHTNLSNLPWQAFRSV